MDNNCVEPSPKGARSTKPASQSLKPPRNWLLSVFYTVSVVFTLAGYLELIIDYPVLFLWGMSLLNDIGLASVAFFVQPIAFLVVPVLVAVFRIKRTIMIFSACFSTLISLWLLVEPLPAEFHGWIIAEPRLTAGISALVVLLIAYSLYALRCNFRLGYAAIEIFFGGLTVLAVYHSIQGGAISDLNNGSHIEGLSVSLIGGFYVFVRGLDNLEYSLRKETKVPDDIPHWWHVTFYQIPRRVFRR